MLGHCPRRLANIIPIKTLYGLITIFNHEHIFYLNTFKDESRPTSPRDPKRYIGRYIRTGAQKCQPFLTHSTHISPKWDTNSGKINLINNKNPAVLNIIESYFLNQTEAHI